MTRAALLAAVALAALACAGPAIDTRATAVRKVVDVSTGAGIENADVLVFYHRTYANVHARTACEGVWRGKTDANGDLRYPPSLNEARVSFVALKEGYVDAKVARGMD